LIFLKDNAFIELYGFLPLDFKKFIGLKKEFTDEELCKLLPKIYYNYIDFYSQKSVNIFTLYRPYNYIINFKKKTLLYKRLYLILKEKFLIIEKYINKHLKKGFICVFNRL